MDLIPARLLQPCVEAAIHARPLTKRECETREHLIDAARRMFIQFGRLRVDVPFFAHSTRTAAITIRRHFGDMHHVFGLILHEYVLEIYKAVSSVDGEGEELFTRRRAAYFRATRGFCNVPTSMHFLLVKDRVTLPADELEPVEDIRRLIGDLVGGDYGDEVLTILDHPRVTLAKAEALITTLTDFDAAHAQPAQDRPSPAPIDTQPTQAQPAPAPRADAKAQPAPAPTRKPEADPRDWTPSYPPSFESRRPPDPLAAFSDEELLAATSPALAAALIKDPKPPPEPPWPPPIAAADRQLGQSNLTPAFATSPRIAPPDRVPKTVSLDSGPPRRMSARLADPAA
jgi:AcrR family transcriptional regulator